LVTVVVKASGWTNEVQSVSNSTIASGVELMICSSI
jgi:hypothetical protein